MATNNSAYYVEELDLSVRAFNVLKRAGINLVRDVPVTEYRLMSIAGMRQTQCWEILEKLALLDLAAALAAAANEGDR
jgi:DNA-directed RNA polymerase alpha subunit